MTKPKSLEKHESGADVAIVQMQLPIYEKELTPQKKICTLHIGIN